jgi:Flp pilus assembly protein TadG
MRLKCTQKGAAMVEFAIVATLLFLLIFGIISYGIMLYDQAVITNAARTGVRAGIVYSVSGNGQTGYSTYPSTCTVLTNNNIYATTQGGVAAGAKSTAQCFANNALKATKLISFGTAINPTITVDSIDSDNKVCPTGGDLNKITPISTSCLLKVTIQYSFTDVYQISQNLTATSRMNYE